MKNLTKIFMAVAVAMFAFSCVTDTTEDLGIEVGKGGGNTQITLSLEESRTQLGEKADGLYPVYWSEGDAIAVNGVISTPLAAEAAGQTSATFQISGEVVYPYCVVYPAPEAVAIEDETTEEPTPEPTPEPTLPENTYPVTFANVQPYTVGTFAPKSAPMYAYTVEAAEGEEQLPIQMQHLSGALRLAVKGDINLTAMTVAAEGKIAGTFLIDCKTGKLTAHEEAVNNISVTFPEGGLKLSADVATPIYVAVPAGEHGIYTITLVSDALTDNTMVVRFNSDFHPVVAGVVKEFGEVTFIPNATSGEEGELVIVNAAQMKRLAQLSEVGQLSNVTKVTVGATIDMSGVADWHGIELLPSHIVFDGGADKGYEIKGLKAPLFGATAATVKNVKLTDVAIVETKDVKVGAIARSFYGTMTNCSASGTLEMNNTEFNSTTTNKFDIINIGGLVGQAGNATFENCENRVNVTIKSVAVPSSTTYIAVGGAIGGVHTLSSLTNIDNYGAITIDVRHEKAVYIHAAGVVGQMISYSTDVATAPDVKVATQCDNHGTITTTAETTGLGASTYAGIVATMTRGITNFSDNHNHGAITCNDNVAGRTIGGVVGSHSWSAITNCTNDAALTNNGDAGATRLGGIIGGDVLLAITNCTNKGVVKNSGDLTGKNNLYMGGISASNLLITDADNYATYNFKQEDCYVTNCHNKAEIIHDGTGNSIFVSGIVARRTSATINQCTNTAAVKHLGISKANCYISGICGLSCTSVDQTTNSGAVIVGGEEKAPESGYLFITGIVGTSNGPITNTSNSGNITVIGDAANTTAMSTMVAGISNSFKDKMAECSNSGDITVKDIVTKPIYIAGIANKAYCTTKSSSTDKWQNVENSGDITLENITGWTGNSNCYIGGLVGHLLKPDGETLESTNRVELYNWTNTGNITTKNFGPALASGATGKEGRTILGGCFGHYTISQFDLNDCDNEGDLNIEVAASSHTFIGGIAGFINQSATIANTTCSMQNCDNSGAVTVNTVQRKSGTITPAGEGLIVSGLFGEWYMQQATQQPITLTNCNNSGAVTLKGTLMAAKTSRHVVGGVSADHYSDGTFINCHNSGAVSVEGTAAAGGMVTANNLQVGGVTAYYHPYKQNADQIGEWIGCTNTGNISIKNIKVASYVMIGGVLGYNQNGGAGSTKFQDCGNSGELLMENISATANSFEMAGIVAYNADTESAFTGEFVNTGNIIAKNVTTMASKTYIGGILGYTVKPIANAKSYCGIWVPDTIKTNVGWIMGIARATATLASKCGVGGKVITGVEEITVEDGNGEVNVVGYKYTGTDITESDYLKKVYAGTTAAASASEASFLSKAPALPTYTPAK